MHAGFTPLYGKGKAEKSGKRKMKHVKVIRAHLEEPHDSPETPQDPSTDPEQVRGREPRDHGFLEMGQDMRRLARVQSQSRLYWAQ